MKVYLPKSGLVFFLMLTFGHQLSAQELQKKIELVFQVGEELKYKVRYGVFTAGEASVRVDDSDLKFDNNPVFHLSGEGHTAGIFALFNKVRDRYDSYIDRENLMPYLYTDNIREGGYRRNDKARFYQDKRQIVCNTSTLKCEKQTFDLVSAYYFARSLDLTKIKEGDMFSINYYLTNEVAKVDITYVGKERIQTNLGYMNCLKFNPSIQPGRIFKKNSKLYLWITDDGNRIPVKAQVEIILGSVVAELTSANGLKYPIVADNVKP